MSFYWFALGAFSVWRITHLFQAEDGPWDLVVRLRRYVGDGFWGQLLDCFYCLSLWVAVPIAFLLGNTLFEMFLLWPALSAGAIVLERVLPRDDDAPATFFIDNEEQQDGLLRTAKTATTPEAGE
ncbi:MAG: DUF1360 domain-containing protein [Geminicoccaceae bacterium]